MVSYRHKSQSSVVFLSSARLIPDIECISSIHLFLVQPLFLLPSPHASIISFSIPFACITWPKNIIFCFAALCLSNKGQQYVQSPSELIRLFSSQPPSPYPHFAGIDLLLYFSCLCPYPATVE